MAWNFFILLFILLISLTGCKEGGKRGNKTLHIALNSDPTTLDPRRSGDPSTCLVINLLYEGLTRYGPSGEIEMAAAEYIECSKSRKTYFIKLKDNLYWSNFKKVTAFDFEYSWKTLLDPNFPAPGANLFFPIKNAQAIKKGLLPANELGVHALNDQELIVDLEYPIPYFLQLLAFPVFFPISEQEELQNPDWVNRLRRGIPTNGPYQLENWQHSTTVKVKRNPYYWDLDKLGVEGIEVSIVENSLTALQLFESGSIDWINTGVMQESPDVVCAYKDSHQLLEPCLAGTFYIAFNTDTPPFDNMNIRKAFALGSDRRAIAENILCQPALTLIPPILRSKPSKPLIPYSSPDEARAYLQKGLQEVCHTLQTLPKVTLLYFDGETQKRVVTALQNQWREVLGIPVELKQVDLKHLLNTLYTKKSFQMAYICSIAQYPHPLNFLERFLNREDAKNFCNWENEDYKKWVTSSFMALSEERREECFDRAEEIFFQSMPIIPLFHYKGSYFSHSYLSDVYVSPIGLSYFHRAKIATHAKTKYWRQSQKN